MSSVFGVPTWCLIPVGVWLRYHIDYPDAVARVELFGFTFSNWKDQPTRLLTHTFIHVSGEHLASNVVSWIGTAALFARTMASLADPYLSNPAEHALLAAVVFFAGGVGGGLSAVALDNHFDRSRLKKKWGYGMSFLEGIVNKVAKTGHDNVRICGASAGIYAMSGFNAVTAENDAERIAALFITIPDILYAASEWSAKRRGAASSSSSSSFLTSTIDNEEGSTIGGRNTRIGHIAHLGGFVAGCLCGVAFKFYQAASRHTRRRGVTGTPGGRVLGGSTTSSAATGRGSGSGSRSHRAPRPDADIP